MDFIDNEYERLLKDGYIDNSLYDKYDVKRGLRNKNGTGVIIGLTKVSEVHGYNLIDGKKEPCDGHLYYRDIDLFCLAKNNDSYGFENTIFLLLFGHLPNEEERKEFYNILKNNYNLPKGFTDYAILKNPAKNLMNGLQKSMISLYSYDINPDCQDTKEFLRKGISILAKMPTILAYNYYAKKHYIDNDSLVIHLPNKNLSLAESILYLIRRDSKFTNLEAQTLDTALIVHADHGGGNNSTFTNVVVSSTGTDIYSSLTSGLASLKGPRHGGANQKVMEMMDEVIKKIGISATDDEIHQVVNDILNKNFYDNSGLIYGVGHAVYTYSDPRTVILKEKCEELAKNKKENYDKFKFYDRFANISKDVLQKMHNKPYAINVDYYSGLTYEFLNIPRELYTPIFATARIAGWISHIIESNLYSNKIIRPATVYVGNKED